jgi:hydroxyacylglutathione hydrolase
MSLHIEPLKIEFSIPLPNGQVVNRYVYCYLLLSEQVVLIDAGVKGAEARIFAKLQELHRGPQEITRVFLTHTHPDHIGALADIRARCPIQVLVHAAERPWIEDIRNQLRERPVPGFERLVAGSVRVDRALNDGDVVELGGGTQGHILHTPGHSPGGICIHLPTSHTLFTGDALPLPDDMPIYDDVSTLVGSIKRIRNLPNVEVFYSSWHAPLCNAKATQSAIAESLAWLQRVHAAVREVADLTPNPDPRTFCAKVIQQLNLPPSAANPLVLKSLQSHLPWLHVDNIAAI